MQNIPKKIKEAAKKQNISLDKNERAKRINKNINLFGSESKPSELNYRDILMKLRGSTYE